MKWILLSLILTSSLITKAQVLRGDSVVYPLKLYREQRIWCIKSKELHILKDSIIAESQKEKAIMLERIQSRDSLIIKKDETIKDLNKTIKDSSKGDGKALPWAFAVGGLIIGFLIAR